MSGDGLRGGGAEEHRTLRQQLDDALRELAASRKRERALASELAVVRAAHAAVITGAIPSNGNLAWNLAGR